MASNVTFVPVNHNPWQNLPQGPTELRQGPMGLKGWLPFVGEAVKQYATEHLRNTLSALALPGNVLQGKVDPQSQEGFAATMALTGLLPQAGMPFAKEGAVGLFGGKLGQKADLKALAAAQAAESAGLPKRTIWEDTGWFKGVDKNWRQEIPDIGSEFLPKKEALLSQSRMPLEDVFSHPELLDNYPSLKKIAYFEAPSSTLGGYFDPRAHEIFINEASEPSMQKSVMLHELQHALQRREGFQGGGMPEEFAHLSKFFPQVKQMQKLQAAIRMQINPNYLKTTPWKGQDMKDIQRLAEEPVQNLQLLLKRFAEVIPSNSYDAYSRLAGEAEARTVQKRYDMAQMHGPEYYKTVPPWEDYPVPSALQLLRHDTPFGTTLRFAGD